MNCNEAYKLFRDLEKLVSNEISIFTKDNKLDINQKDDRSLVTKCDKYIDKLTRDLVKSRGLQVISEERENDLNILKSGNYVIIDAIDGTSGYIKHTKSSDNKLTPHINRDLGFNWDYSFLTAIVIDGNPRFGFCHNYVTGEDIFLSSGNIKDTIWENSRDDFKAENALYVDNRSKNDGIQKLLSEKADGIHLYSSPGLAFVYAQLRKHKSSVIYHFAQQNGLWDIAPACVISEITNTRILDGNGDYIKFRDYLNIPNKGLALIRGNNFSWIKETLKRKQN